MNEDKLFTSTFTLERINSIQDALKNINGVRNVIGLVKNLIAFICGSPKRLSLSYQFQAVEGNHQLASLRAFCPALWIMRVVCNIIFDPFFVVVVVDYVISERVDTSFPNVRLRHFRTC